VALRQANPAKPAEPALPPPTLPPPGGKKGGKAKPAGRHQIAAHQVGDLARIQTKSAGGRVPRSLFFLTAPRRARWRNTWRVVRSRCVPELAAIVPETGQRFVIKQIDGSGACLANQPLRLSCYAFL
jgi:hypothetical protein